MLVNLLNGCATEYCNMPWKGCESEIFICICRRLLKCVLMLGDN